MDVRSTWQDLSPWERVVVLATVLLVGSLLPLPRGRHDGWGTVGPDKVLHLVGHGGLAVTMADALGTSRVDPSGAGLLAVVVSSLYGVVLGQLQGPIPGREHESADVAAGLVGSVIGVIGWLAFPERFE